MSRLRQVISRNLAGYAFASPWLIGFFALMAFSMVASILLSMVEWNGINISQIKWVGFDNYTKAFKDENFWIALKNTFYYSFISVPLTLTSALILAVMLNQKLKGISFFRTVFYMPHVIGGVATLMMWIWVFKPEFGLLSAFLRWCVEGPKATGLASAEWRPQLPGWLYDPDWSKPSLIVIAAWQCGQAMLLFLAALQNVPDHLYEAARIDGAGKVQQFWYVTVPQISPVIFFNLVMGIIASFQVFNQAYIVSNGLGGPSKSLLFYILYLYNKAFRDYEMGYASAMAWILFVIVLVFTMIILRSSKMWVYYEGEGS